MRLLSTSVGVAALLGAGTFLFLVEALLLLVLDTNMILSVRAGS